MGLQNLSKKREAKIILVVKGCQHHDRDRLQYQKLLYDSVVYKTINIFRPDHDIYFFSDVPHLIKTCRNCLLNSRSGRFSRYMWNNGIYLLWQHTVDVYKCDLDDGLHMLPKLSADHILLNSYSVSCTSS